MPTATTYATEQEAILSRLSGSWSTTPVAWPNKAYKPTEGTAYIEPVINRFNAFKSEIANPAQVHHPGLLTVNIRVPLDQGELTAIGYGDTIAGLYRNLTTDQITYRDPTVRTFGRDGSWYLVQVDIPFTRRSVLSSATA